ncbi:MAG: hypothetical protein KQH79_11515 [Bacteroidetes bacterium]|nr:hypothetical protein [Bacteroidota bacterium]
MIKIGQEKIYLKKGNFETIKENFIENTCKTNLSPGLMFRQSYTGVTEKAFVGNWKDYGFWISKFRLQMLQLRPDIIAKFIYLTGTSERLLIRYSIGFSSLIFAFFIGFILTAYSLLNFEEVYYFLSWIIYILLYAGISAFALKRMKKSIKEKILNIKDL